MRRFTVTIAYVCLWLATSHTLHTSPPIPHEVLTCTNHLGPIKCIEAFSIWSADKVLSNSSDDFSWRNYENVTGEEINAKLCDGVERMLRRRSMQLSIVPGYDFELLSKENGVLKLDIYKQDDSTARGSMKKLQKRFYAIVPLLLIPGLIMSAILPFVLPALKMMTVGVGILNNMALSGAIFTLLRNNAFNDHHHKKILYVNEGYKNEKHKLHHGDSHHVFHDEGLQTHHTHVIHDPYHSDDDENFAAEDPSEWMNQYHYEDGNSLYVKDYGNHERSDRIEQQKSKPIETSSI